MSGRSKFFIIIPAIILIPILLGMPPLNFIQKIGSGCPLTKGKHSVKCSPCLFHSLVSQDDLTIVHLNSNSLNQEPIPAIDVAALDPDSIHSNIVLHPVPLRC